MDDGSCVLPPTEYPFVVDDFFAPTNTFGEAFATVSCPVRAGMQRGTCHGFNWTPSVTTDSVFAGVTWVFPGRVAVDVPAGANQVSFFAWRDDDPDAAKNLNFLLNPAGAGGPTEIPITEDLTTTPTQYTIAIPSAPSTVIEAFGWVSNGDRVGGGGEFYIDDIVWESAPVTSGIFPLPARTVDAGNPDSDVEILTNTGPLLESGDPALLRVGRVGSGGNTVVVIPLEIPDTGGAPFTSANFSVPVRNTSNGPPSGFMFDLDLIALPARNDGAVIDADYDAVGTTIMEDFVVPGNTDNTTFETDAAADTALVNYLNTEVERGDIGPGDFIFLRLEPVGSPEADQWWFIWGVEATGTGETPTQLSFDTE
ncbi:MAG: hypothetical protein AAF658_15865 [Myxococcota bacterium]